MELMNDPEFSGYFAVFISEVHAKFLEIKHPVVALTGYQVKQLFVDKSPCYPLGMIGNQVINRPAHLLMNRRDITPDVVYPCAGASAADRVGFFHNRDI